MKRIICVVLAMVMCLGLFAGCGTTEEDKPDMTAPTEPEDTTAKDDGILRILVLGHSLGMDVHEAPNASPMETNPLPEGAVLSAEPGIYIPGQFGVRIEDVCVITKDGCEDITNSPKELLVL